MKKTLKLRTSIISVILSAIIGFFGVYIPKIDTNLYSYMIINSFASYFKSKTNDEIKSFKNEYGFLKGVCHPNGNYKQISDANIKWVRFDLTALPYDSNGNLTAAYKSFKATAKEYTDNGFKVMCVTPYPHKFIEAGLDPRDSANTEEIKNIAAFLATDLQGIVGAFQITNEMGLDQFMLPLTIEEAANFIGIQIEAMNEVKGDIIVGYNIAGTAMCKLASLMKPYNDYCDYVGADIYLGCFENIFKKLSDYDLILRFLWNYTHKPILLCEFGYIGYGQTKTDAEKLEILNSYGAVNEDDARANINEFVNNIPPAFKNYLLKLNCKTDEELATRLFDTELVNHLYREIPAGYQLKNYEHTPDGQAKFFTDVLARFKKLDFVCGAFVYCCSDSSACYVCGQEDCPVETGWGLIDLHGNPKPAYYAVQNAFADM